MLEVTILKTNHSSKKEARKLLPYIQECDVFSPEAVHKTEEIAEEEERNWRQILLSGISRSAFVSRLSERCGGAEVQNEEKDYYLKMFDYLYTSRKPIIFVERFDYHKSRRLSIEYKSAKRNILEGYRLILSGDEPAGLACCLKGFRLKREVRDERDQHIASVLCSAEDLIRNSYPQLARTEPIRLKIQIGCKHRPERFSGLDLQCMDFTDRSSRYIRLSDERDKLIEATEIDYDILVPILRELAKVVVRNRKLY